MPGERAISQRVKAANGRLAALLRSREEDDAILKIGRVRIKELAAKEAKSSPKGGRVAMHPADFTVPLPRSGRPRAADGITTTFHFEVKHVTKSDASGSEKTGLAVEHAVYVERSEAVETGPASEHAGYLEREEAVEIADRPLVFSNISADPRERREYWRAVERSERTPHPGIDIDPANPDGWWKNAALALPEDFLKHCVAEQRRRDRHREAPKALLSSFNPKRYYADRAKCDRIISALERSPGWSDSEPMVRLRPGLGGRTQYRFVAELPHELSQKDRIKIVEDFCAYLGTFARNEQGEDVGLMYTAVIHKPGPDNDHRNYHLHVIAHDRPASWRVLERRWDFECAESFEHRGEIRTRYPYRQDKIPEVTRRLAPQKQSAFYNDKIAGKAFVPHLREKFAGFCNERLAHRGIKRRIDARSHNALGIDKAPEIHLGTRASALERIGVPTLAGRFNQASSWHYQEKLDGLATQREIDQIRQAQIHSGRARVNHIVPPKLLEEQALTLSDLEELTRLVKENERLIEQALSKAQLLYENCSKEIQRKHSAKVRRDLEIRLEEARKHISLVRQIAREYEPDLRLAPTERGELIARYYELELRLAEITRLHKRLALVAKLDFSSYASPLDQAKPLHAVGGIVAIGGLRSVAIIEKTASGARTLEQITSSAEGKEQVGSLSANYPSRNYDYPSGERNGPSSQMLTLGSPRRVEAVERLASPIQKSPPADIVPRPDQTKTASALPSVEETSIPLRKHETDSAPERANIVHKAAIEDLLNRISRERLVVGEKDGKPFVEKLSSYDTALLSNRSFSVFIQKRLSGIAEIQRHEIRRLISAIEKFGPDLSGPHILTAVRTLARHWGDHSDVLKASNTFMASVNPSDISNLSHSSLAKAPTVETKSTKPRAVDMAREHARRRDKDEHLVASKARMENAGRLIGSTGKPDITANSGLNRIAAARTTRSALANAGLSSQPVTEVGLASGNDAVIPACRSRNDIIGDPALVQPDDHVDLDWLHGRLAMLTLPLREKTLVENGRERTIITLVVNNAVPEDVELVTMAARHQSVAIIQELLQSQFKQLMTHVVSSLSAEPNASADRKWKLLNVNNGDRLGAALAAAAGSPSFTALVEADRGIAADDELGAVDQLPDRGRRGFGIGG